MRKSKLQTPSCKLQGNSKFQITMGVLVSALLAATGEGFSAKAANGTVTFGNNNSAKVINGQTGLPVTNTDNVRAALYWSPVSSNAFVQLGATVVVGFPSPGLFAAGTRTTGTATPGGTQGRFQVRAWSGGFATFEQAATNNGVLIGQSGILQGPTGDPGADPPTPPNSLIAYGLQSFTLTTNGVPTLTLTCANNKPAFCGVPWTFDPPTANTTCSDTNVTITVLNTVTNNGHCPPTMTRTWLATDTCGDSATCSQTATVIDPPPPMITCASNKTVECGSNWSFDPPTAVDQCTGASVPVTVLSTQTNGVCPQTVQRKWQATNACGSATCIQTVTVADTTPPTLSCARDKRVECGSPWSFDPPVASDTCSGTNVTIAVLGTATNGVCPPLITRTWLATDACGNTTTCSQTVTVVDTTPPALTCATNKTVPCGDPWSFDPPTAFDACSDTNVAIIILSTVTNGTCQQNITRTWQAADLCGNTSTCSQTVTITCGDLGSPGIAVTKNCPSNAVPPGGLLVFSGMVTNTGNVTLTNVIVFNNQPASNTVVFGPITLDVAASVTFTNSYFVPGCSCGPFADTLTAIGTSPCQISVTNFATASCPGTNVYLVAGDLNGDGIVDEREMNIVLSNYLTHAGITMSNPIKLGGGRFQFEITNASGWSFTVLASSNLVDWTNLPGPATPVFQFFDPAAATNAPNRFYRLRYP